MPRGVHRLPVPRTGRRRVALVALALIASITGGAVVTTSGATFIDQSGVGANTLGTGVVQPPTNVAATSGTTITLTWTATQTTTASGYHIYRSSTAGALGNQVADVTPRTATTWTDNNPTPGNNFYVLKAYVQNWESGSTTESVGTVPTEVYDNFNGTSGSALGTTEAGGLTWAAINGTWTRNGSGLITTPTAIGSNPMAVVDLGSADATARTDIYTGSGEAIYFRVQDGANWLRARYQRDYSTYQYYNTEYQWANYNIAYYQYTPMKLQRALKTITTTLGSWQGWVNSDGGTTACRNNGAPTSALNSSYDSWGNEIRQKRWVSNGRGTCALNYATYTNQENNRTSSDSVWCASCWVDDGYAPRNTSTIHESFTGATQVTTDPFRSSYVATSAQSAYDTRGALDHYEANPSTYTWSVSNTSAPVAGYQTTGATRQAGPYTGSTYNYYLYVDKSVAGTVTTLGSYGVGSLAYFSVTAQGSTIKAYGNGTLYGTITETAFQNRTQFGVGLGGSATYSPGSALTYAYFKAL